MERVIWNEMATVSSIKKKSLTLPSFYEIYNQFAALIEKSEMGTLSGGELGALL